ncbi:ParB/RepB/Spo0J family partition protein (plasmid) [Paenibacillus sp. RS8]|uniref:ParB/RepB/Spo0J family partition protein n=1 Tax=Paenibacillus sp. RS8 TaxID=3242681 RepID=UPI0035C00FF6
MDIDSQVTLRRISQLQAHPDNEVYNSGLTAREEAALKASIAEHGIQEALLIRPDGTIVSGHQRARIATALGIVEAPVRMVECTDPEAIYLLVAMNEARRGEEKDLMKKARRVQLLYERWGIRPGRKSVQDAHFSRHDVAKSLKLDDSSVRRLLKLLYLIPELQEEVSKQTIGLIAANKIAALDKEKQSEFLAAYRKAGGNLQTVAIEKIITQLDTSPDLQAIRREKQKRVVNGKVERIKKDLTWLTTVPVDDEERQELGKMLRAYAGYLGVKGGPDGEIND